MADVIRKKIPLSFVKDGVTKTLLVGTNLTNARVVNFVDANDQVKLRFLNAVDTTSDPVLINEYTNYALELGYSADWILKHKLRMEGNSKKPFYIIPHGGKYFLSCSSDIDHLGTFFGPRLSCLKNIGNFISSIAGRLLHYETEMGKAYSSNYLWPSYEDSLQAFSASVGAGPTDLEETTSSLLSMWYGAGGFTNATLYPTFINFVYSKNTAKNFVLGLPLKYSMLGCRSVTFDLVTNKVTAVTGAIHPKYYLDEFLDEFCVYTKSTAADIKTQVSTSKISTGAINSIASAKQDLATALGVDLSDLIEDNSSEIGCLRLAYKFNIPEMVSLSPVDDWLVEFTPSEIAKLKNPTPTTYSDGTNSMIIPSCSLTMNEYHCRMPLSILRNGLSGFAVGTTENKFVASLDEMPNAAILFSKYFDQPDVSYGNNGEILKLTKIYSDAMSAEIDLLSEQLSTFEDKPWTFRQADNRAKTQCKLTNTLSYVCPTTYSGLAAPSPVTPLMELLNTAVASVSITVDDETIELAYLGDSASYFIDDYSLFDQMYVALSLFDLDNPNHVNNSTSSIVELLTALEEDALFESYTTVSDISALDSQFVGSQLVSLKQRNFFDLESYDVVPLTSVSSSQSDDTQAMRDYAVDPNLIAKGAYLSRYKFSSDQWNRILVSTVGCHNESLSAMAQSFAFIGRITDQHVTITV